ncbi:MAG: carbohydrate kinase [Firmicutes bacterium]|nr:carbohydrate kinase [Bacillota bacterium]
MKLIGIDIGTTHCKVGLFDAKGRMLCLEKEATITHQSNDGRFAYDPEELWQQFAGMLKRIITRAAPGEVQAIAIASMAEAGLLVDKRTGKAKTEIVPWYDQRTMEQYEWICQEGDERTLFSRTGLYPSYKHGLAKILWFKEQDPALLHDGIWLSTADYLAYRLTGQFGTDHTLAARTYAYRIDQKKWDEEWLAVFGLKPDLFPPVKAGGSPLGEVRSELGFPPGIKVSVTGHDHLCAALAVGAIKPGVVFDSIGTAESLIGTLDHRVLGEKEYNSRLSFGCHVVPGKMVWIGGLSAAGGSLEWLRKQLGDEPLSYQEIETLLASTGPKPTGIIYYPYLSGSGAPLRDPKVRGALIGLRAEHGKADLLKAILEGTAYEMEAIRRAAAQVADNGIEQFVAVGGGTRNQTWMRIKATVSDCAILIPPVEEATLLGAVLLAAIGTGIYRNAEEAVASLDLTAKSQVITPWAETKARYRQIFEEGYLKLQHPIRKYFQTAGQE